MLLYLPPNFQVPKPLAWYLKKQKFFCAPFTRTPYEILAYRLLALHHWSLWGGAPGRMGARCSNADRACDLPGWWP